MALKCWKKGKYDSWKNVKNQKKIVEINPYNKSYIVQNEKGFNSKGLIGIASSKAKAFSKANSYMKKHDRC